MKNIGIFVKYHKSIFTNGCIQQGYFVLKSLRKFAKCNFITTEENFKTFNLIDETIDFIDSSDKLDNYDIIIFSSAIISNFSYLSYCKLRGITLINLMVGNYYILNQEEIVFNTHNVIKNMNNIFIDEIWMMPMYSHTKEYIEFMCNKKVKIVPYVWDSTFIDSYISKNSINPHYILKETGKINILIMEPNMSIHKTCLGPLLIANKFFLKYPNKLNKIILLCKPKSNYKKILSFLEIVQFNKIEDYSRHISLTIFAKLNNINKNYVILSSNIRNNLNFLHLEAFYLGIPIIHNCEPFKSNELYYSDNDQNCSYSKAVDYLLTISSNGYEKPCKFIIDKYNPYNKENIQKFNEIVESYESNNIFKIIYSGLMDSPNIEIRDTNLIAIYQDKENIDLDIISKNLNIIKNSRINNLKIVIYTFKQVILNNKDLEIENIVLPKEYKDYILLYLISIQKQNKILLFSLSKLINLDLNTFFSSNSELIYIENKDTLDISSENYRKNYWLVKNIFNKLGTEHEIKLIKKGFIFYKNNDKLVYTAKLLLENNITDYWYVLNSLFLLFAEQKKSINGSYFYLFDKTNNLIGNAILKNNIPIIVHYNKSYTNNLLLVKAESNRFIKNKENIHYNVLVSDNKIYEYNL